MNLDDQPNGSQVGEGWNSNSATEISSNTSWSLNDPPGSWPGIRSDLKGVILSVPQIDRLTAEAEAKATIQPVPEPGTWLLIGLGAAFMLWRMRRFAV